VFIVTVPTPIDSARRPDLGAISAASRMIGRHLKPGAVVIYESTVYPGCTEEICVPILEQVSGLTFNRDFFCGYSPERANPGDRQHRLSTITKVTAGSTRKPPPWSTVSTARLSPPAPIWPARSRSPRRPR
jgi:UDP-N-acetyl-D-galactosamine dehydrogenase